MKLKHLESALSSLQRDFPNPNIQLEQYPCSPAIAAAVVLMAMEDGHVGPGRQVLDLGCGTGMLTAAAVYCEADHIWAVDCDETALAVARENVQEVLEVLDDEEHDPVSFLLAKVKSVPTAATATTDKKKQGEQNHHHKGKHKGGRGARGSNNTRAAAASTQDMRDEILNDGGHDGIPLPDNIVDTVLTNPPFGTKGNPGMDLRFLKTATRLASRAVYSFHKTSTRAFLQKHVETVWGLSFRVVAQMKFDIPQTYKFHKQSTVDVEVDLIRIDLHDDATEEENIKTNTEQEDVDGELDERQSSEQRAGR